MGERLVPNSGMVKKLAGNHVSGIALDFVRQVQGFACLRWLFHGKAVFRPPELMSRLKLIFKRIGRETDRSEVNG